MKRQKLYGTRYNAMAGYSDMASPHVADQVSAEKLSLAQAVIELAALKQALIASQEEVATLSKTNASFKLRLIRMAKKYVHAQRFGYHDELTGLPNRSLLMDRLKQAIVHSARQHKQVALLFIDLDKFKQVNDSFGHAGGDQLLQQVAQRLTACLRYGDTACRYGGDEFVIMLPEIEGHECVAAVTKKIRTSLAASYDVDGKAVDLTASIGSAVYRNDGQDCSDLIKQADTAMYLAKAYSVPIKSFETAMQM